MKKMITALVFLAAQTVFAADPLFFSSKVDEARSNEYCSIKVSVPQVLASATATQEQKDLADALNADWQARSDAAFVEFNTAIAAQGACADEATAHQVDSSFMIMSDLGDAIISIQQDTHKVIGADMMVTSTFQRFNQFTGDMYADLSPFIADANLVTLQGLLETQLLEDDPAFDMTKGWADWKTNTTSTTQIANYYFNNEGIVVHFDEAAVAPTAKDIQLSWEEVDALLITGGPADLLPTTVVEEEVPAQQQPAQQVPTQQRPQQVPVQQ